MKLKSTFLTAFFFLGIVGELLAQDKYEYGSLQLSYCAIKQIEYILSKSTPAGYEERKIEKSEFASKNILQDITPLVKEMTEMNKKGWELCNAYSSPGNCLNVIYSIRRKI